MEFSCSRRVQAKLSHPDRKKAASPDFSIHLQALLAILPLLDPKIPWLSSPCVIFPQLSFSSYYFPWPCFCTSSLSVRFPFLLRHYYITSPCARHIREQGGRKGSPELPLRILSCLGTPIAVFNILDNKLRILSCLE